MKWSRNFSREGYWQSGERLQRGGAVRLGARAPRHASLARHACSHRRACGTNACRAAASVAESVRVHRRALLDEQKNSIAGAQLASLPIIAGWSCKAGNPGRVSDTLETRGADTSRALVPAPLQLGLSELEALEAQGRQLVLLCQAGGTAATKP